MKFLLLFIVSMFLSIPSIGQNEIPEIRKSFYEKGFSDIYKIDNSGIYLSRIFKFDNYSEKELRDRVSAYLNRRIERRISDIDANSENLSFDENSMIISESTPIIKINFAFYSYARYTYRIEVKENRIRSTIFINSYHWGDNFPYLSPQKFYPFKKVGGGEKCFTQMTEYLLSIFDSFPKELFEENPNLEDDW